MERDCDEIRVSGDAAKTGEKQRREIGKMMNVVIIIITLDEEKMVNLIFVLGFYFVGG